MITDLRQSKEYTKYMELLGWQVLQLNEDYVYVRKVLLIGSVAKLQRPQKIPTTQDIKNFCAKNKVSVLYIEPQSPISLQSPLLSPAKNSFVPAKTIHVDLTLTEQTLLENMKHKTRYNIKVAQRHVVVTYESRRMGHFQMEDFIRMYSESARQRGMWIPQTGEIKALWNSFSETGNADLLLAYDSGLSYETGSHVRGDSVIGGVLVCYSSDTAHYMYAGSTQNGKQLFAPTLLAWEAIKLAKKRKKKIFDFEGVYDERYPSTKQWRGFTKFKEGFGGEVVEYPQTLAYYKNPLIQLLL